MSVGTNMHSDDELADAFKALFDELHAKIEALPEGALKHRAEILADVSHRAMNRLKKLAANDGVIQPFSGGDPKDEPPQG